MVVLDPKTGYIKAMVGGKDYNANESHVNHALGRRSPGSSFKTFTLAAAIKAGMSPNVMLNCSSPLKVWGSVFQNYGNHNYGSRTLAQATAVSSNTGFVQVAEAIGNKAIIETCRELGIDTKSEQANFQDVPALTLGTASITRSRWPRPTPPSPTAATTARPWPSPRSPRATARPSTSTRMPPNRSSPQARQRRSPNVLTMVMVGGGTGVYGHAAHQPARRRQDGHGGHRERDHRPVVLRLHPAARVLHLDGPLGHQRSFRGFGTADLPLPIFRAFMNSALAGVEREELPHRRRPAVQGEQQLEVLRR